MVSGGYYGVMPTAAATLSPLCYRSGLTLKVMGLSPLTYSVFRISLTPSKDYAILLLLGAGSFLTYLQESGHMNAHVEQPLSTASGHLAIFFVAQKV